MARNTLSSFITSVSKSYARIEGEREEHLELAWSDGHVDLTLSFWANNQAIPELRAAFEGSRELSRIHYWAQVQAAFVNLSAERFVRGEGKFLPMSQTAIAAVLAYRRWQRQHAPNIDWGPLAHLAGCDEEKLWQLGIEAAICPESPHDRAMLMAFARRLSWSTDPRWGTPEELPIDDLTWRAAQPHAQANAYWRSAIQLALCPMDLLVLVGRDAIRDAGFLVPTLNEPSLWDRAPEWLRHQCERWMAGMRGGPAPTS